MKKFQDLLGNTNRMPPKANRQRNITMLSPKPAFFQITLHRKDPQKNQQPTRIQEPERKNRINSFQNLFQHEKSFQPKTFNQVKRVQSNSNQSKNNLFSQLSTKNLKLNRHVSKDLVDPTLNSESQHFAQGSKIYKQRKSNSMFPKKSTIEGVSVIESVTASRQNLNEIHIETLTEQEQKEIEIQMKKVKKNLMFKIVQKNGEANLNFDKLIDDMKLKLTQQTQKLVKNTLKKRTSKQPNFKSNSNLITITKKSNRTPTTQKSRGTPCFEEFSFRKKQQNPVNEFSLFENTKQKVKIQSHEADQTILSKIQLSSTGQNKRNQSTGQKMDESKKEATRIEKVSDFNQQVYQEIQKNNNEIQIPKTTKLLKNYILSGKRKSQANIPEICVNQFQLN